MPLIGINFTDGRRYYDAFDSCRRGGSADAMVELIDGYLLERLDGYIGIIAEKERPAKSAGCRSF